MNRRERRGNRGGTEGVWLAEFFTPNAGGGTENGTGILPVMDAGHRQDADATSALSVPSAFSVVNIFGLS
jgi:hypothetical protein